MASGCERDQALDDLEVRLGEQRLAARAVAEARAFGRRRSLPVLAGEQPAREREVRDERETLAYAFLEHALLRVAPQQAVLVLHAHEARHVGPGLRARLA